jgi:hypothetical protein
MKKMKLDASKGFTVTTSKPSIVTKLRVYANTVCEGCDPITYKVVGIASSSYLRRLEETTLQEGNLPWINEKNVTRNPTNVTIVSTFQNPDKSLSYTQVVFANDKSFTEYAVTFDTNREAGTDLIVGEVELVGVVYESTDRPTAGPTKSPATVKPTKDPTVKPTGEFVAFKV